MVASTPDQLIKTAPPPAPVKKPEEPKKEKPVIHTAKELFGVPKAPQPVPAPKAEPKPEPKPVTPAAILATPAP